MNRKILCSNDGDARSHDSITDTGCGMSFSLNDLLNAWCASGASVCITGVGVSYETPAKASKDMIAAISTGQKPVNPFNAQATASAQQEPAPDKTEKR